MNIQHKEAYKKWNSMPFLEQVANIGSEVHRALNWRDRGEQKYADQAFIRALELFDFTLGAKNTYPQTKEMCRAREMFVDFYKYDNEYHTTAKQWRDYFDQLLYAYKMSKLNADS